MRRAELCLAVGIAACIAVALAAVWRVSAAAQAWLAAYLFWIGMPIGALFVTLVHGLVGGRWGLALRPALSGMVRATPLLAVFLIPLLVAETRIYPWGGGGHGWLYPPFFAVRAIAYVVLWNAIAFGVLHWQRPDGRLPPGFAWPALIVLFGTTTLAAFDWIMTLEPRWTSTIYGLLVTTGWVLCALAVALALMLGVERFDPPRRLDGQRLDSLARIMLGLVVLWAYLAAVQLIVIWESNLTAEIPWYLRRISGGWQVVAALFGAFEFLVPFLILLWRPLRRSPRVMLGVAAALATAHLGEIWWLTVPDFGRPFDWIEPVAMAAIGGCVLFVIGRGLVPPASAGHAG